MVLDVDLGRCFIADGLYFYIINLVGRGLSKLGFGLYGIFRLVACRLLNDCVGVFFF